MAAHHHDIECDQAVNAAQDSMIDQALHAEIAAELGLTPEQLAVDANLLQLGLDSMRLMAWLNRLRLRGYQLTLRELYRDPTLAGWSHLLRRGVTKPEQPSASQQAWPTMRNGRAFALTPVQHAYLVGRSPQQTLGGVGCHLYQEFDGAGLTPNRLEPAVYALIARHPMLRVKFRADGQQQWREQPYWRGLTVHDLRDLDRAGRERALLELRNGLHHRVLAAEHGETFDFQLSLLPKGRHRLHVNIDLLILDAASFSLLFEEIAALVTGKLLPDISNQYDFCSYLAELETKDAEARIQAQHYWREKLARLPPAPALPLAQEPGHVTPVRFTRRRAELDHTEWREFRTRAAACGVTPTMALATCFAAVLARWSSQSSSRLLLNLTLFDRQPLQPSVDRMIADFTNILLLDLDCSASSFDVLAQANQSTFTEAYEHRHWSGVEVLRELRKEQRHPHGVPVVFTSNLGHPLYGHDTATALGEPAWGISQTPQVWIDHVAFELGKSVWLQWDSHDELFPTGLVDTLFDSYLTLVRRLVHDDDAWRQPLADPMPANQRDTRARINATARPLPAGRLHEGFFVAAERTPDAVALIHNEQHVRYEELADLARRCAGALIMRGVQAGDRVAVSMDKGIGQIVAVLGTLYAGAIYVPVPLEQPAERRCSIYDDADVCVALICQEDIEQVAEGDDHPTRYLSWQDAIRAEPRPHGVAVNPAAAAYVIYTSGSTGMPKGVMVSHQGALNTCAELNRRYRIEPDDRVLGLSALHFDLSVYDIFGVLAAGGALVLLDEAHRRDPATWCNLLEQHHITIWNSVPALFDMLLTHSEGFELQAPSRLRLIMLSGDWIGLHLPARYRAFRADGEFVAMGGATEASIWSNAFDVKEVPADWHSIPYGYPLANQRYRVVDEQGRDCPDWVPGELWIGGTGVALGYFNDAKRTAQQFVESADERWYRTGDMGCYWPDGTLEFLGRRDKQVKIGGYRIELGEIEAALHRIDGVKSAIALALGEREKSLAAFVVPSGPALYTQRQADPGLPSSYRSLFPPVRAADSPSHDLQIERLVADFLQDHLLRQGLSFDKPIRLAQILERYGAQAAWQSLFERWLALLVVHQRLNVKDGAYCCGPRFAAPCYPPPTESQLFTTTEALLGHHVALAAILRGQRSPQTLLDHPFWAPEQLLLRGTGTRDAIQALVHALTALSHALRRPVQLIEIGARSGAGGAVLLQHLDEKQLRYTGLDASQDMVLRAQVRLAHYPHGHVRRWDTSVLDELRHSGDVIWANNALHRIGIEALTASVVLAAPSALIHILELHSAAALTLVSADLLAPSKAPVQTCLRHEDDWNALFQNHDLRCEYQDRVGDQQRYVLHAPAMVQLPDSRKLNAALAAQLPSYMLPHRLYFLDALPLTANGKVEQQALVARCTPDAPIDTVKDAPRGEPEQAIASLWQRLLQTDFIHRQSHFFQLGGDSLLATRLIGELDQQGYAAQLGELFDYPTLAAFAATVEPGSETSTATVQPDPASRSQPFPLTDIQQAYLVGRQPGFALGGVGSHFFVEFEVEDLDVSRFEAAWNRLLARHDMLRAVVHEGQQRVMSEVPAFILKRHRFDSLDDTAAESLRDRLAHQVLNPEQWPVFDVQAAEDGNGRSRIYICLDNLVLDGLSMQILLAELEQLYLNPDIPLRPLDISFRDYLVQFGRSNISKASQSYWQRRLDTLPPAPQLPLQRPPAEVGTPHFVRLSGRLSKQRWNTLKERANASQLTPSGLLLAAYAATLSAWSSRRDLTLNLTLFDRQPVHAQIEQVLGDFTSLLLLAWQPDGGWLSSARRLQQRLWQDLAHRDVSGLWVMRQLAQRHDRPTAEMPVVFTSALGFDHDRFLAHESWLRPRWGISQTPQVWLDHQVYASEGELRFNWDAVKALFSPDTLHGMFDQYVALLQRLADDASAWQLPLARLVPRAARSATARAPNPSRPTQPPFVNGSAESKLDESVVNRLREHFKEVVGLPIAARQSFFEAGASSLKLVQLHLRLQQLGFKSLAVTDLFAYASPYALALHLGGATRSIPSAETGRQTLLQQRRATRQRRRGETA